MKRSTRKPTTDGPRFGVPGAIAPECRYRLGLGWGGHALRAARRRGLKIHRSGKRGYVTGADLLAFITKGGTHAN